MSTAIGQNVLAVIIAQQIAMAAIAVRLVESISLTYTNRSLPLFWVETGVQNAGRAARICQRWTDTAVWVPVSAFRAQ